MEITPGRAGLILTFLHYREFFGQGWMKVEKNEKTPYIMKNTKHFNDVSLVPANLSLRRVTF